MPRMSGPDKIIRFGVFEVSLPRGEIRRSGLRQKLGPQPFEVLRAMLERPGELVTREELRARLWPKDTFVDYELALKKCVNRIRQTLGDSAEVPRYVETVRGQGYRFIAPVTQIRQETVPTGVLPQTLRLSEPADGAPEHSRTANGPPKAASRRAGVFFERWSSVGVLVPAAIVLLLSYSRIPNHTAAVSASRSSTPSAESILPVISLAGEQSMPALSPDGSRVAFVWQSATPAQSGIYAAVVGTQSILRMTRQAADCCPSWSPDGRYLAFFRTQSARIWILQVPALGGVERVLYTGDAPIDGSEDTNAGLSYSPDGKTIAFNCWNRSTNQSAIARLSLDDSAVQVLTVPPAGLHDGRPVFSPDGLTIAFIRSSATGYAEQLFAISALGGMPRPLTFDRQRIFGPPSWNPDGREIIFSSNRAGLAALWRVPASGGVPERVPGAGPVAWYPSVSAAKFDIAYENVDEQENLWRIPLTDSKHAAGAASILIAAAKTCNCIPNISPDGRKIAFQSGRSGYPEIWISEADGSHPVQATDFRNLTGTPRWSPDSRYLAFDSRPKEHSEIKILDTMTGRVRTAVALPSGDNIIPSWSHDGHWLYFASNRTREFEIWKVAVADGVAAAMAPLQITYKGGYAAFESADRARLFFTKIHRPGIWSTGPQGGAEQIVWPGPGPDYWSNWAVGKRGFYLLVPVPGSPPEIVFIDFQTLKPSRIAKLSKPSFFGFSVSPDEHWMVYSQWDRSERNILLMKNVR